MMTEQKNIYWALAVQFRVIMWLSLYLVAHTLLKKQQPCSQRRPLSVIQSAMLWEDSNVLEPNSLCCVRAKGREQGNDTSGEDRRKASFLKNPDACFQS